MLQKIEGYRSSEQDYQGDSEDEEESLPFEDEKESSQRLERFRTFLGHGKRPKVSDQKMLFLALVEEASLFYQRGVRIQGECSRDLQGRRFMV
jgi:hypothetical protein